MGQNRPLVDEMMAKCKGFQAASRRITVTYNWMRSVVVENGES